MALPDNQGGERCADKLNIYMYIYVHLHLNIHMYTHTYICKHTHEHPRLEGNKLLEELIVISRVMLVQVGWHAVK